MAAKQGQLGLFDQPLTRTTVSTGQRHGDVCANRHRGSETSREAWARSRGGPSYERVLAVIAKAGDYGATTDEVAVALGVAPNRISGRLSQLKADRAIVETDRKRATRTGCTARVCVVARTE